MQRFSTPLPQLRLEGRHLIDPNGNAVILRGFNLCSKTAQTPEQLGFNSDHTALLQARGATVVRLGLPWACVQPYLLREPDTDALQYDWQYLASIKRTIQLLAEAGIYTLVDFHQDAYSVPWGFGAPIWAIVHGGTNQQAMPWPFNTFGGDTFQIDGATPPIETDLNYAFDAFWGNEVVSNGATNPETKVAIGLLDAYAEMLRAVSSYLSDQQGNILGYDPLNEPEPGSEWTEAYVADPQNLFNFPQGCEGFDTTHLLGFYQYYAIPKLQEGHPEALVWYEPNIYFDYNAPTFLPGDLGFRGKVGFNFHNYDTNSNFAAPVTNALKYQNDSNGPLLCSEFGGTTVLDDIRTVAVINDQNMFSAIFWAWFNNAQFNFSHDQNGNPTDPRQMGVVHDMSLPLEAPNVNFAMLDVLTRAYPRVTGGMPLSFSNSVDPVLGPVFSFTYTTQIPDQPVVSTDNTVIVVPVAVYTDSLNVSAPGAEIVSQTGGIVELKVTSSTPVTINVTITPQTPPS